MPRSVPCTICGQMFLPSGLKFHMKSCEKKQATMMANCPYCKTEMLQISMDGHVATCKAARRAMENQRKEAAISGGWVPDKAESLGVSFSKLDTEDGRKRCQFCGRGFTNDRFHIHQSICCRLKQARPPSVGGVRTQLPQRIYNAAAARTTQQGSFDRQRQKLFIPRVAAENRGILVKNAGVARKIGSKATATIAPWQVLGVDRRASTEEIKRAYKKLAMQWHPDKHSEDTRAQAEAKFKAIAEAYEAMTRPRKARAQGRQLALVAPGNWRSKHREWQSMARGAHGGRQARGSSRAGKGGQRTNGFERDDRVQCPHCGRRFGQEQAERHIPKCLNIVNKPAPPPRSRPSPMQPALPSSSSMSSTGMRGAGQGQGKSQGGLAPGTVVKVDGLVNAAHLNGAEGVLTSFDAEKGRWNVNLPGGEMKAMKPENLILASQGGARPSSGKKPPQARMGRDAEDAFPPKSRAQAKAAYRPPAFPSSPAGTGPGAVPPATSSAPSIGDTVRIQGLINAAHLNRQVAVIQSFDQESQRWRVELQSGETKAVRVENLEVLGPARRSSPMGARSSSTGARDHSSSRTRIPSLDRTLDRTAERNMYR